MVYLNLAYKFYEYVIFSSGYSNILVEFSKNQNALEILYSDDGSGMSELLTKNPDAIFDLGVRDSKEKGES